MKANCVEKNVIVHAQTPVFRGERTVPKTQTKQDEFVSTKAKTNKKNNNALYITGAVITAGVAAFLTHKAGWWGNVKNTVSTEGAFKKISDAKKYFEDMGINTEFRDVNEEHLPLLNRIKDDLKRLKEMGVKKDKPDTLTISDWHKAEEYEELCRQRGITMERRENYHAFCAGDTKGASHVFINTSHPETDYFRHEMGHANHNRGHDSFWEAKGVQGHDFADKQLALLGEDIKIYRGTNDFSNIFHFNPEQNQTKFAFPNQDMETRFVYINDVLKKMQNETGCYAPDDISEQVAYVFDGLVKGNKTFSDEVMLYYDFAGGARIPNLKINGKTYDEYIESLYNNNELIQKLRNSIMIAKL